METTISLLYDTIHTKQNELRELTNKEQELLDQLCAVHVEKNYLKQHIERLEKELKGLRESTKDIRNYPMSPNECYLSPSTTNGINSNKTCNESR